MTAIFPQFEHGVFNPETTHLMGEAFDRACLALNDALPGVAPPGVTHEAMANRILEEARWKTRPGSALQSGLEGYGLVGRLSWLETLSSRPRRLL
jgi:hypothetical protein